METKEKERRMKIALYMSRASAQNAARQAAYLSRKKAGEDEKSDGRSGRRKAAALAGRLGMRSTAEESGGSMVWGGNVFRRGLTPFAKKSSAGSGARRGFSMWMGIVIAAVLIFMAFFFAGCGKAEPAKEENGMQSGEENHGQDGTLGDDVQTTPDSAGNTDQDGSGGAGNTDQDGSGGAGDGDTAGGAADPNQEADASGTGTEGDNQEPEETYKIPEIQMAFRDVPDTEAFAFVRELKVGWSLGNTLDAYVEGQPQYGLATETSWGSPRTTFEMIRDVKEAGFETLRIPVTWHPHMADENYTIAPEWLDRVQEVVDYGIDNGMKVILNIHHDTREDFIYPDPAHIEQSKRIMKALWSQIAERFAEYDDHLIFESMNEPRLVGTPYEWMFNANVSFCQEAVSCINELNQLFVDTVRKSGGNNKTRYLMVPGYCASPDGVLCDGFALPQDAKGVTDRIMVSVHAYIPYNFALQAPGESGSSSNFYAASLSSQREIVDVMNRLYDKFITNSIPVVIGEFGARDKHHNTQSRVEYAAYYVAIARMRGMSCLWWDNNLFYGSGELFGLYDRKFGKVTYPDIVDALMRYAQ